MASTFSNLKFELIGTGDQSGTWGTTTNTNLGTAIEQALVGMATISSGFTGSPLTLTLTLTDTNAAQNARALVLNLTQALGSAGTLNVPAIQKPYMIINATGQTVTVKVTGLTGVAVPTGTRAFLYNNGTDVGDFFNYASSLTLGTDLAVADGGTGASTAPNARTNLGATTVGSNLFTLTNPSAITFLRINADNTVSALDAATFRTAIGAGTTSGAAGSNTQVQYNNAGAFAGSSNLTFDGTSLTLGGNPTLSAGTANGVLYLNGSKVATSGSALTFDGSTLTETNATSAANLVLNNTVSGKQTYINLNSGATVLNSVYRPATTNDFQFDANYGSIVWGIGSAGTATEQMRLTSTGLGIGTSSPSVQIDANKGGAAYSGNLYLTGKFTDGTAALKGVGLGYDNTSQTGIIYAYTGSAASNLSFWTYPGSGSATERMRLDSSGNLDLATGKVTTSTAGTGAGFQWGGTTVTSRLYDDGSGNVYLDVGAGASNATVPLVIRTKGGSVAFNNGTSQTMTLDASGNLGIGTSSPSTKLQVVGTSTLQGVTIGTDGTYAGNYRTIGFSGNSNGNTRIFATTNDSDNLYLAAGTGRGVTIWTNGSSTNVATFDSSGNVGIGLTPVANNGILQLNSYGAIKALIEGATVSATAATGTINYDAATQAVVYYTSNASANWTVNFRGSGSLSLNSMMQTGQSLTVAFLVTQGSTAYYNSAVQVDGSSVTPKWQGGTAPSAGNASSIDSYVYTIIKTGSATFTVLASQTKFA